jgi:hypothetical protein
MSPVALSRCTLAGNGGLTVNLMGFVPRQVGNSATGVPGAKKWVIRPYLSSVGARIVVVVVLVLVVVVVVVVVVFVVVVVVSVVVVLVVVVVVVVKVVVVVVAVVVVVVVRKHGAFTPGPHIAVIS